MGYCIDLIESKFTIKAENKDKALKALKQLGTGDGKNGRPIGGGGSYTGGKKTESWFAFMNDVNSEIWESLKEAMTDWGYPVTTDTDGNVTGVSLSSEKQGEEDKMFAAIAPFVESGSYLTFQGEDGATWQYAFDGTTMVEKLGRVIFV